MNDLCKLVHHHSTNSRSVKYHSSLEDDCNLTFMCKFTELPTDVTPTRGLTSSRVTSNSQNCGSICSFWSSLRTGMHVPNSSITSHRNGSSHYSCHTIRTCSMQKRPLREADGRLWGKDIIGSMKSITAFTESVTDSTMNKPNPLSIKPYFFKISFNNIISHLQREHRTLYVSVRVCLSHVFSRGGRQPAWAGIIITQQCHCKNTLFHNNDFGSH